MEKTLADFLNLKTIITIVLSDYELSEQDRNTAADRIVERYKNNVKEVAKKFLEKEVEKHPLYQAGQLSRGVI